MNFLFVGYNRNFEDIFWTQKASNSILDSKLPCIKSKKEVKKKYELNPNNNVYIVGCKFIKIII